MYIYKGVSHKLFLLRRFRPYLTYTAALAVLKTMFLPRVDYGNLFLTNCSKRDLDNLHIVQNHAIRCLNIQGPRNEHVSDMHELTKVKLACQRREKHIIVNMHKKSFTGKWYSTIQLPVPRSTNFAKFPFYTGATMWNDLPANIRNIILLLRCKKEFKHSISLLIELMLI